MMSVGVTPLTGGIQPTTGCIRLSGQGCSKRNVSSILVSITLVSFEESELL